MKEIASALVRAQKAFGPALKTSNNPHFRSKYASLDACIEAVLDGLNDNGIMLTQKTFEHNDGVVVETVFIHESGEVMEMGRLFVPASKGDAQGFGSALTYARRYSLMAACGIAPEDDDGAAASKPKPAAKPEARPEPKPAAKAPVPAVAEGREGSWQLRVTAEPDGVSWDEWADIVIDTAKLGLGQCHSKADVMEIFKVNRNIFDRMKAEAGGKYDEMMAAFKEAKEKFKE
jgi:hypothetical protein